MGVVRSHVEEERLAAGCRLAEKRFDFGRIHIRIRFGQLLEGKCAHRRDVPLALHGHPVAAVLQVFGQRLHAVVDVGVVGVGPRPHGIESRQQAVARGRTHGRRLEEPREAQSLGCQPVDVGRHGVGTAVTAEVEHARVVRDDEHDVGPLGRSARGKCRQYGRRCGDMSRSYFHAIYCKTGNCADCA